MTDWRRVPKTEIHLHLEGAAPPAFIRQLAAEKGMALDHVFDDQGGYAWDDFSSFLATYHAACQVLDGPQAYGRLTEAVLAKSAADGVVYTEIFVAPQICGGGDEGAWRAHLDAIVAAAASAEAEHGIVTRFISIAIRNFGAEAAEATARLTARTMGPMLTGFGMGGEERFGAAADYAGAFAIAAEAGLGLTSHAGELAGADSVRETLDHLRVGRIGHGVRAIEDLELVARLAGEGIVLEVNPGSNIALSVFPDWSAHPIARLRAAGVKVTVSTDDPPYFRTDMVQEYRMLAQTFGWSLDDFRVLNHTAMDAAFCDGATRARIKQRIEA